jgi:hypothetical protein
MRQAMDSVQRHIFITGLHTFSKKSRRHLKIVDVRMVTLQQVTCRGPPNIRRHSTNVSRYGDSASRICAPLLYKESAIVITPNHVSYVILLNLILRKVYVV